MRGEIYAANVAKRLVAERERSARQDTRGGGVITTATTMVSLVVALVALLQGNHIELRATSRIAGSIALALLAVSAACGVMSSVLRRYKVPERSTLEASLDAHWRDSDSAALLACAWMDLDTLLSLRAVNDARSWWLDRALWSQLAAVVALGCAAIWGLFFG